MKSLAIHIPLVGDATSFYRAAFPIGDLRQTCKKLQGLQMSMSSHAHFRMADGAFFQRPHLNEEKQSIQMAKDVGLKVWLDYDDWFLGVPTDNPTYTRFMNKETQEIVKWCLANCDILTVSTQYLADLYKPFAKKIVVIPNALDTKMACVRDRGVPKARNKTIMWRGSPTHARDVFRYVGAILHVSRDPEFKEWMWHFVGDNPWIATDSMPHLQTFYTRAMGAVEYHVHIANLLPAAMQVPLDDSPFNRCKSNIAWMEAAFAGACSIVPNWDEWRKPGALIYKDEAEYASALYAVLKGEVDTVAMAKQSWEYVMETLTLRKVNEQRIDVLCELFECDRKDLGVERSLNLA